MENLEHDIVVDPAKEILASNALDGGAMLSENFIEKAGKQIDLRARLLHTALRALKNHDIQDFDGKPYIEGEGAARIMSVVRGFRVGEAKFAVEQIHPHFFIECQIPIEFMGATTVAIGDCSTADPFFTGRDGNGGAYKRHLDRTGSDAMAGRLLLGDAKKKARENAVSRGVTELLGLKGLSWDDLAQLGFSRAGAGVSVAFKKGSQGGEIKTLDVSGAVDAPVNSKISVSGLLENIPTVRHVKTKNGPNPITAYPVTDGKKTMSVQMWGNPADGVLLNEMVCFKNVSVTEYNGKKQYLAEIVEAGPTPPAAESEVGS